MITPRAATLGGGLALGGADAGVGDSNRGRCRPAALTAHAALRRVRSSTDASARSANSGSAVRVPANDNRRLGALVWEAPRR